MIVSCVDEAHALLGEAPFWDAREQTLFWVDIYGRRIHALHPTSGARRHWQMPDRIAAAVPREGGGMLVALSRELALFDPADATLERLFALEPGEHGIRFNDSRTDSQGRLWIGSMNEFDARPTGKLYRFDGAYRCTVMETGIAISNSISFSPDDTRFYLADTLERIIRGYDFDAASGQLGDRRDLLCVDGNSAMPDGSAVDAEGYLWNAQWNGARVVRYAPDGSIDRIVPMPVSRPTSCVFGGAELSTLYVTSSCMELDGAALRAEPLAGSLFAIETGVRGRPCTRFAG